MGFDAIFYELKNKKGLNGVNWNFYPTFSNVESRDFLKVGFQYILDNGKTLTLKRKSINDFNRELLLRLRKYKNKKVRLQYAGTEASMDSEDRKDKEEREKLLESYVQKTYSFLSKSYEEFLDEET